MKKITIATALIIGMIATSFAEKSSVDAEALNIFKVLMTTAGNTSWQKKNSYTEKSFLYKGQELSAYYKSGKVIGLSCRLIDANDLPKEIVNEIKKKYNHHEIADVLIFMDSNGNACYYAGLKSNNTYTALKISATCRLHVIKKMRIK
jgi:hypothetical protein